MSNYRRVYEPGQRYFFTVVTFKRIRLFSDIHNVGLLREAFRYVQQRKPFKVDAICVLPDHLHCVWSLQDDCNYSVRWQMIKTHFSRSYRAQHPASRLDLWQPRFWEHVIRNQDDYFRHIDYIHYNPVKHGLVSSAHAWQFSSYSKFYQLGYYDELWGSTEPENIGGMFCE